MVKGMTKAKALEFEKLCEAEITKILGEPEDYGGNALAWKMPYGATGEVTLHLFRDSFKPGRDYKASWLACRLNDPSLNGPDGYKKPNTGHPYPFAYISGKFNLHPDHDESLERMRAHLAHHLYALSAEGSDQKRAFGTMQFEAA